MAEETGAGRLLTLAEVAGRYGIAESTWRSYVSREQAPGPDERNMKTGAPLWLESTLEAWKRPGRGRWGARGKT
jgi:hypothetical protein